MSDSGFGQISSPSRPAAQNTGGGNGQIVKIIGLPQSLKGIARAIRLEGQVTAQNNNGSIRITTAEGNIDIEVKNGKQPQLGQRIEIDVPAGKQPRQATLRDAPIETNARHSASSSSQRQDQVGTSRLSTPNRGAPNAQPPQSMVTTEIKGYVTTKHSPIPPSLQETGQTVATNNTAAQARPLLPDALVRLLPTPPAQAQNIATEYLQTLPPPQNNLLTRILFASTLIAESANDKLGSILIQALTTPVAAPVATPIATPAQQQPSILNLFFQNLAQPIGSNTLLQPITNNNILLTPPTLLTPALPTPATTMTSLLPTPNTAVLPQSLTLPISESQNILPASGNIPAPTITNAGQSIATLTPLPVIFDPSAPVTQTPPMTGRIDVHILSITPPAPTLGAPTLNASTPNIVPNITEPLISIPAKTNFTPPLLGANNAISISAQVTGFTAQNLPLVTAQWPGTTLPQSFVLQFSSNNLQLGSQLQLTPRAMSATIPSLLPQVMRNPLLMGFQWPALEELYNALLQISPESAASLTRSLPNPANPSQIGPAAMMFIAAVRAGDLSGWLGDKKIDLLQKSGHDNILEKLVQRGNSAARTAAPEPAAPTGEWRAVPLPMFWEGALHKITLYTRQEQEQQDKKNQKGGQTRFVFDLSLSRMGDVQLDGLLRDKRLDLVVRTQNAFSLPMQQTMRLAYASALGSTDLMGELNFQSNTKNWVHVLEEKEQLGVSV